MKTLVWSLCCLFPIIVIAQPDPAKVVGPQKCEVCHRKEHKVWSSTTHYSSYRALHRSEKSQKIMGKLGLQGSIRRQESCQKCHYTLKQKGDSQRIIAGISCESCHGAAKEWWSKHFSTTEKSLRRKKMSKLGMNHPGQIYAIAENCYQCHLVPDEKVVNTQEHPYQSKNFDFLTWSQGVMRHTFLRPPQGENTPPSPSHRRILFVVGKILAVEYQLRGFAKASQPGLYAQVKAKGLKQAAEELYRVYQKSQLPQLRAVLNELNQLGRLKISKQRLFLKRAENIRQIGYDFVDKYQGSEESLTKLDPMIPPASDYVGESVIK